MLSANWDVALFEQDVCIHALLPCRLLFSKALGGKVDVLEKADGAEADRRSHSWIVCHNLCDPADVGEGSNVEQCWNLSFMGTYRVCCNGVVHATRLLLADSLLSDFHLFRRRIFIGRSSGKQVCETEQNRRPGGFQYASSLFITLPGIAVVMAESVSAIYANPAVDTGLCGVDAGFILPGFIQTDQLVTDEVIGNG